MKLIHPIYLDVPMLVSFAAAIEGGVSLTSEVTSEHTSSSETSHDAKAALKLSKLFQSFFDGGIEASAATERSSAEKEVKKEARAHTEASIAILLYDRLLKERDVILRPNTYDDFRTIEPGSLVELYGTLAKNAVDAMIDYIDALVLMSQLASNSSSPNKKADAKMLESMRNILDKDRKRTPLSNVLMHCRIPEEVTASITLRRENLRDLTFSELHKNAVRIVGKVTRVIDKGQSMSAFENYGLSMLPASTLESAFKKLAASDGLRTEFSDVDIQGPAVQILPLMIYV